MLAAALTAAATLAPTNLLPGGPSTALAHSADVAPGPVILDGTDSGLHGSVSLSGATSASQLNSTWFYELKAWETLLSNIPTSYEHNGKVALVGAAHSTSTSNNCGAAAHYVSERVSTGAVTVDYFEGSAAIDTLFDEVLAGTADYAMIQIVEQNWCSNGMDNTEASVVNASGAAIAAHVNRGGALFTQSQSYGWLSSLFPNLNASTSCSGSTPELTAEGYAQFPGLTNAYITAPWHNCFTVSSGEFPLSVLALQNNTHAVILGGLSVELPSNVEVTTDNPQPRPGETVCTTAVVTDAGTPVEGASVEFSMNGTVVDTVATDASGTAVYCYVKSGTGNDIVTATVLSGPGVGSTSVQVAWSNVALTATPGTALARGNEVCVDASVGVYSGSSVTPSSGTVVTFTTTGANATSGTATTNGSGIARYCYTGTNGGTDEVQASIGTGMGADSRYLDIQWTGPRITIPDITHPAGQNGKVVPMTVAEFTGSTNLWVAMEIPAEGGALSVNTTGLTITQTVGASLSNQQSFEITGSLADITTLLGSRITWNAPAGGGEFPLTVTVRNDADPASATMDATAEPTLIASIPPTITLAPADQSSPSNMEVTFTAAAAGYPAPHVHWWTSTDNGVTWTKIPMAHGPVLTFVAGTAADGDLFRVNATSSVGTVDSAAARLTVTAPVMLDQTITFGSLADTAIDATPPAISATVDTGLPLTITAGPPGVCTYSGSALVLVGQGTCTVTVSQAGDASRNPATVSRSFTVLAPSTPQTLQLTLSLETGRPVANAPVLVSGTGLKPNSLVRIELHSDPILLGTAMTDDEGSFSTTVNLPEDVPTGQHQVIAIGESRDGDEVTAVQPLFVDWSGAAGTVGSSSPTGGYTPVDPQRLVDTRTGELPAAGSTIRIGMPAGMPDDLQAVVVNVTATDAEAHGFLTVHPCSSELPLASSVNYVPGTAVANLAVAQLGGDDELCVYTSAATHVVVDLNGYYSTSGPNGFAAEAAPRRLADTRTSGRLTAGGVLTVDVPAGAAAVSLYVAAVDASDVGYLTVYPCGTARPLASNVNYGVGQTVGNDVLVKVGTGGTVCVYTHAASDVVVDLAGTHRADGTGMFTSYIAGRLLDTRSEGGLVAAGSVVELDVIGDGALPDGTTAVSLNVTVAAPLDHGFVTVFPCGADRPLAAALNYSAGNAAAAHVTAKVGVDGKVCVYTLAATHLVVDIDGSISPVI